MTVKFVNDIGIYTGEGRLLTSLEIDTNFYDLLTRTIALETGGSFGLDSIGYTGGSITFNWSDSTTSGPFALPIAMPTPAGEWLNDTTYHRLDLISVEGVGQFMVLQDHTTPVAPAEFDPDAVSEDTDGDSLYFPIGYSVDLSEVMRYKGLYAAAQVYEVDNVVTTTIGAYVVLVNHVSDTTFDPSAVDDDDNPLYRQIAGLAFQTVEELTDVTKTVSVLDAGRYFRCPNGCEVTLPADIPADMEFTFRQTGDDPISWIEGSTDVVINPQREGFNTATDYKGSTVTAKSLGSSEWDLIGPYGAELTA